MPLYTVVRGQVTLATAMVEIYHALHICRFNVRFIIT